MKFILASLLAASLLVTSCSTIQVSDQKDLAAPVAAAATAVVLGEADNAAERKETAERLIRIASVIEDAFSTEGFTGSDIVVLISEVAGDQPEYAAYAIAIGMVFDRYVIKLGESESAAIIRDIATGIRAVATPYL
jgi:hypothetical protein